LVSFFFFRVVVVAVEIYSAWVGTGLEAGSGIFRPRKGVGLLHYHFM